MTQMIYKLDICCQIYLLFTSIIYKYLQILKYLQKICIIYKFFLLFICQIVELGLKNSFEDDVTNY